MNDPRSPLRWPTSWAARAVPDAQAALAAGVDGVVIAAATPAHARLILAAVEAGIPVFCEKPIAFTADESRDVVARLANSTVPVQIGYNRRFDPAYLSRPMTRCAPASWAD